MLSSLSPILTVEEGGTERSELGHGLLVGNGDFPVITLEPQGYNVVPIFTENGWLLIPQGDLAAGGGGVVALDDVNPPTQAFSFNGQKLTDLASSGLSGNDAASVNYVNNFVQGLSVVPAVKVTSFSNIDLNAPGTTIDGVVMSVGDRFLAANQNNPSENGIYVWQGSESVATRTSDAIEPGTYVFVQQGSQSGKGYTFVSGTGFTQFSSSASLDFSLVVGLLKSDGSTLMSATPDVDYLTPESIIDGGTF